MATRLDAPPGGARAAGDNPYLPIDGGMTSLGLLMQLVGGVMVCLNLVFLLFTLINAAKARSLGGAGAMLGLVVIVALSGAVRSGMHYGAGLKLATGAWDALDGARRYVWVALGQTVVVVVSMIALLPKAPTLMLTLALVVLLMAWPLLILVLARRPRVQAVYGAAAERMEVIDPRDHGFQGAGVLMTTMGIIGVLFGAAMLFVLVSSGVVDQGGLPGILILGAAVLLVIRSIIHVNAGLKGLRGDALNFPLAVQTYVNIGLVAVVALMAAFLITGLQARGMGGPFIIIAIGFGAALMGWPVALRGMTQRREWGGDLTEGDDVQLARDGGLTAMGYVLLGMGVWNVARGVAVLLAGHELELLEQLGQILGGFDTIATIALFLVETAVMVWAGVELVTMGDRLRVAGNVYGVVAAGIAIYSMIPAIEMLDAVGGLGSPAVTIQLSFGVGVSLVLPGMALWLVNRPLTLVTDYAEVFE